MPRIDAQSSRSRELMVRKYILKRSFVSFAHWCYVHSSVNPEELAGLKRRTREMDNERLKMAKKLTLKIKSIRLSVIMENWSSDESIDSTWSLISAWGRC